MNITLEWTQHDQTHTQTIDMHHIVDFGRAPSSHIKLNDKTVSRRHAIIYPYKRSIFLQNISQTNKIWIDRQFPLRKGESILLQPGVQFNIGRIRFKVKALDNSLNSFSRRWCMPVTQTLTQTPMSMLAA